MVGPPRAANRIVRLCTLPGGNAGERRRASVIPMEDDFETDDDLELQDRREAPDYRMLIRGRSLVFSEWHPGLLGSHQVASTLERRGGARPFLADAVLDDRGGAFGWELIVMPLAGRLTRKRRELIMNWARLTGYRRLWLEPEIVEFEALADPAQQAAVSCAWCGSRWCGRGQDFWATVWERHRFPRTCRLCGCRLIEWSVA